MSLYSCTSGNTSITSHFSYQGHRGCRGLYPENTIPAMLEALKMGVNTLEMDVVISKDSQIIVSHEPFFNHEITTTPLSDTISETDERKYNIFQMNYEEIKKFDVGIKPHPRFPNQKKMKVSKPTLSDLIDSTEAFQSRNGMEEINYNIETKCLPETDNIFHPDPIEFSNTLMTLLIQKRIQHRVIIQSFDPRTLQYIHLKYPTQKIALLVDEDNTKSFEENIQHLGFNPTIYSPNFNLVTKELVTLCHKRNIQLIPWTVNSLEQMKKLIQLGVDGLISDFPNLYKDL